MTLKNRKLVFSLLCLILITNCSKTENIIEPAPEEEELIDIYVEDPSFKIVGYLPSYRFWAVNDIDFSKIDYVNIAFANFDNSNNIVVGQGVDIRGVVNKIKNAGAKVLLSIAGGGLTQEQHNKWRLLLNATNREATIHKLLDYLNANNLDGIDVDIEGSLLSDLGNDYNHFIKQLKDHLHAENKPITAALNAVHLWQNITSTTLRNFDFINIMAYDEKGLWNINDVGQHSSYQFAQRAVNFWMNDQNLDPSRLVLGVPFYGVDFNPTAASYFTYSNIISNNSLLAFQNQKEELYYNGIPTIVKKTQLAFNEVNGVMIWELGQDDFSKFSLFNAIDTTLNTLPCAGEVQTFFRDEDEDGKGDHNHFVIACNQPDGFVLDFSDTDDTDPNT
jgi:spore germination protein YaaH